jgi:hypothetical protein
METTPSTAATLPSTLLYSGISGTVLYTRIHRQADAVALQQALRVRVFAPFLVWTVDDMEESKVRPWHAAS